MEKYKKIVILDSVIIYPEHRRRLDQIAEEVVEYNTCANEEEVLKRVNGADCIISCWVNISNRVITENPQLKTIAFWTHAYEHRIDKKFAEENGIFVPCIPDYGTDSVAELLFIGLLKSSNNLCGEQRTMDEAIIEKILNDVRNFDRNVRSNLRGSWTHEYVKNGDLKIVSPDEFVEETLKGMTIGLLLNENDYVHELIKILSKGLRTNVIHSLCDIVYDINASFRPIDELLDESNVLVYDPKLIAENDIDLSRYASVVDISKLSLSGASIKKKKLGIIGLGRIGTRVAQIARDAFDMDVTYYSQTRKEDIEKELNISYGTIEEVLTNSDIISFHLPHVGAENFITKKMIDMIPKGTFIANVSVGNIFEEQDYLFSRFNEDDLKGYIDVYETLPPRQFLRDNRDYILSTYRLGWRTKSTIGLKTHKLLTKLVSGQEDKNGTC